MRNWARGCVKLGPGHGSNYLLLKTLKFFEMCGESIAPNNIAVFEMRFKQCFVKSEESRCRKEVSNFIEKADILRQFSNEILYVWFKVKWLINIDP